MAATQEIAWREAGLCCRKQGHAGPCNGQPRNYDGYWCRTPPCHTDGRAQSLWCDANGDTPHTCWSEGGYSPGPRQAVAEQPVGIAATLAARGGRYGAFADQAKTSQALVSVCHQSPNWELLAPDQKDGLYMIAVKISRILNGDANYLDSWHDIAGYATLVEDRLKKDGHQ